MIFLKETITQPIYHQPDPDPLPPYFGSPLSHLGPFGSHLAQFNDLIHNECIKSRKMSQRIDLISGGHSGQFMIENYMGFIPLIPSNLPTVDHNEIKQNAIS